MGGLSVIVTYIVALNLFSNIEGKVMHGTIICTPVYAKYRF